MELAPSNIAIPTLSRQSHEPLISFDHGGGASQNRKARIGFRDNQARTDDFHHVKVTLYRWVISLPCPHREIELTNPKSKGRETQRHYSWTTRSRAFFSHYYGYGNNGKNRIPLSTAPIGRLRIRAIAHGFIKSVRFSSSRFYMKKILFSMFYSILVGEEPDSVLLK